MRINFLFDDRLVHSAVVKGKLILQNVNGREEMSVMVRQDDFNSVIDTVAVRVKDEKNWWLCNLDRKFTHFEVDRGV